MKKFASFIFLFVLLLLAADAFAAKRYWISSAGGKWNSTANWSSTSGGGGGASVPSTSDTAYFDGGGTGNDTLDMNISVKRMEIASGYTGTIVQGSYTVTFGTSGATLSGGTFAGGSGSITCSGAFVISGCAFTSTSGTLSIAGDYTLSSGSFTPNGGLVKFNNVTMTATGSTTFYQLEFAASTTAKTFTIASGTTLTVNSTLTISGNASATLNTGAIAAKGDFNVTNSGTAGGGTATITLNGSGTQTLTGNTTVAGSGRLPNIIVNKSAADTLKLASTIVPAGSWTHTAGVVSPGTSTFNVRSNVTVSGSFPLYALTLSSVSGNMAITISSGSTLTVNDLLKFEGTASVAVTTGTIHAKGNVLLNNSSNVGGGTGKIVINGSGTQTVTGNTTSGNGRVGDFEINKSPSDTVKLLNYISVTGDWTYTSGIIDAGTSTVNFINGKTISGSHALNNVTFTTNAATNFTLSSGTTLTVNGTLTLAGGANSINFFTGTIQAQGDVVITNTSTSTSATGNASLVINGAGNQSITGNSTADGGKLPNVTINKTSGTLTLAGMISVAKNWTYTAGTINPGSSTVVFSGTKTISGKHTLGKVTFMSSGTFTLPSDTLTVSDSLFILGSNAITLNTGVLKALGHIKNSNASSSGGGSATLYVCGTANQTLEGNGTAGAGRFPKIVIDKDAGDTLTLNSIISEANDWTYIRGTVNPGTSTLAFYGSLNLDGQGTSATMPFYNVSISSGAVTLTGDLDANNNLGIASGATLTAGSYHLTVGGKWTNTSGTWSYGTSTVTFDGSGYRDIKHTSGGVAVSETFYDIAFNRSSGSTTLNSPVIVNHSLTLTKGRIKTSSSFYLELIDNATCTAASDSAYVHGPVRKTGDDAFTFPLGDTTLADSIAYHPLAMTAPSVVTDQFEAEYFAAGQTLGDSLVDSLASVSSCERWSVERKTGSSNVSVTVSWNKNSCNVDNYDDLRVGGWDGSRWIDLGGANISASGYTGSVSTSSAISFSPQTQWTVVVAHRPNTQPYAVLKKKLDAGYFQVTNGKLMFRFDEEYNDPDAKLSFRIYNDEYNVVGQSSTVVAGYEPIVYYGSNYYLLNVLSCEIMPNGVLTSGFFILEVINDKNEHWYLRFKHTTSITVNCPTGGSGN